MNQAIPYLEENPALSNARIMLSLMLIAAACLFVDLLVGTRSVDVGTDTGVYTSVFVSMRHGYVATRWEPAFTLITRVLAATGVSVATYQCALFLVFLGTVVAATRRFYDYLESHSDYLTFLTASLAFLFISPVLTNASVNAVRQGLASLLVFTALLAFHQRKWRAFILYGLLATSFHYSSILYLLCAPALLLSPRTLRAVAVAAFLAYCSGLTMILVRVLVPPLYTFVITYEANVNYRSGVRLDFAVFSIFWYLLPYLLSRLVSEPARKRINDATAVYLVLMLPFFAVGWGSYSNRYLLPAWLSVSLVLAAIFVNSRTPLMRNPLVLRGALVASCGVFYYYVTHMIIL